METILDIFNNAAFSAVTLTGSINIVPNMYGKIQAMGLFRNQPIPTKQVAIEINRGVLNLIPSRPRTAPPSYGVPVKRQIQSFGVPYFPHDDAVYATEVQDLISWNGGTLNQRQLATVVDEVNRKLAIIRNKHAITLEWLRMSSLSGILKDADGSTLVNYFTAFGITQQSFDFTLAQTTTDIRAICALINGYMEDNLLGETMTGVYCLASPTFLARMLNNAKVQTAYNFFNAQNGTNPQRDDVRTMFKFGGIIFEEYRGVANALQEDNTTITRRFVTDGEAIFFPLGTQDTFVNYWGPVNFMDLVNTPIDADQPVFVAPLERMKFGMGVEMHTESSPLPMVKRPGLLVRGFSST